MKQKMFIIIGVVAVLFVALFFAVDYKNKQAIKEATKETENPYGKSNLAQETIDQLDDPLYQNQIIPKNLDKKLENKEDILVYFYKSDCPHCHVVTPILVPLTEKMDIDMKKVNLLEFNHTDYWNRYLIKETPTLVYYKNGEEEARIIGEQTEETFQKFLEEHVK